MGDTDRETLDAPAPEAAGRVARRSRPAAILAALAVAFIAVAAAGTAWLSDRFPLSQSLSPLPEPAIAFAATDGSVIARRGAYKEAPVVREELPDHLVDAVLTIEDRRFYEHPGFDLIGVARAAMSNYRSGEIVEGGSTITQQLARFAFLSRERTMQRKVQEVLLALWLEYNLTKDEILVRYLSSAYFGDGVYGLRAAARHYFDKDVRDLTLGESVLLVASLRAPSLVSPSANLAAAQARARLVLRTMAQDGRLSEAEAAAVEPASPARARAAVPTGSHFTDWLAQGPLPDFPAGYGEAIVATTLDPALQAMARKAVDEAMEKRGAGANAGNAALVAMRTDGRVVAMIGGREAYGRSQFNRATQALRQPGSAFKLFVYLAALRDGARPDSLVVDRPVRVGDWTPRNFGGRHRGEMSLRGAFASSINTVAVDISEYVGRRNVMRAARDLGVTATLTDTPSLALGSSEVTLLELTAAYAAVAAGAYPVRPWGLAGAEPEGQSRTPLREARELRQLLHSVVQGGTGRAARLAMPAFGKTGTSQDHRDAWFIGFAGDLVAGVWVGNDDNAPMKGVTGGNLPAQIWHAFMTAASRENAIAVARAPDVRDLGNDADWDAEWGMDMDMPQAPQETRRRGRVPSGEFRRLLQDFGFRF